MYLDVACDRTSILLAFVFFVKKK